MGALRYQDLFIQVPKGEEVLSKEIEECKDKIKDLLENEENLLKAIEIIETMITKKAPL